MNLASMTPADVAKNIVNQIFDETSLSVPERQRLNDQCDKFVSELLSVWEAARLARVKSVLAWCEQPMGYLHGEYDEGQCDARHDFAQRLKEALR